MKTYRGSTPAGDRPKAWLCDRCGRETKGKDPSKTRADGLRICMSCRSDTTYIALMNRQAG